MIQTIDRIFKSRAFFWLRIAQFFLATSIFTFAALMPAELIQTQQPDKLMHFLGNMLLFLSAYVASGGRLKLWLLILLLLCYSMLVELSQGLTLTRHVDPKDAVANVGGLIAGFVVAILLEWYWHKLKRSSNTV